MNEANEKVEDAIWRARERKKIWTAVHLYMESRDRVRVTRCASEMSCWV